MSIEVGSLFVFRGEKFIVQSLNESSIRVLDEGDILYRYLNEEIIGNLTSRWPTFVDWKGYFNKVIQNSKKNLNKEELQQFIADEDWDKLEHIISPSEWSREDLIKQVLEGFLGFYHFEDRPKAYHWWGVEDELQGLFGEDGFYPDEVLSLHTREEDYSDVVKTTRVRAISMDNHSTKDFQYYIHDDKISFIPEDAQSSWFSSWECWRVGDEQETNYYIQTHNEDEWIIFPSCDGLMDKRFDGSEDDYFDEEDRFAVIC